jgi:hypothetical protein
MIMSNTNFSVNIKQFNIRRRRGDYRGIFRREEVEANIPR